MPRNSSVSRPHKIGRTAPLTLDAKDADDLDDAVVRKGRKDNTYVLEMAMMDSPYFRTTPRWIQTPGKQSSGRF